MSCCPVRASRALVIGPEYILSNGVVRCSSITPRARGSALRSDCAEVWSEVECDLMKRSRILSLYTC
jgi:hypothetical protein